MAEILDPGIDINDYQSSSCSVLDFDRFENPNCPQYGEQGMFWAKFIGLMIVAIIALVVITVGFRKIVRYFTRPEMTGMNREQIRARWTEIRKTSEQGLMGAKLAIIEAYTLLYAGLKSMMFPGDTLGERLKVACYKYPKLRDVWPAHKLRNSIAHEVTFQI